MLTAGGLHWVVAVVEPAVTLEGGEVRLGDAANCVDFDENLSPRYRHYSAFAACHARSLKTSKAPKRTRGSSLLFMRSLRHLR